MTQLRDVIFMSQAWAEGIIPKGSESIISITDHGAKPADLNEGWNSILRIQFDDLDPDEIVAGEFEEGLVQLTDEQATRIASFIFNDLGKSATLVVHCRFGQSRSPAVAKAICEHYHLGFPTGFESHNKFVYRLVAHAISRHGEA